ncbi:uncharacterized protein N0V89_002179 [Didymosphaeria variabile]|uniref:Uncharacterized protein n=1 Tax=Didymosphaeria variabile TaxID=1932322 RepID=A0A9W8XTM8_9PLEO|nr:uncharacterized protein N0V89_002179 [Didymosphaeria variabile]KAJ4357603.1 hypothetical protein N0V89_002179 [Didymosphaeria variabile]
MPSLYGAGVRMHLATHSLASTLTEQVQLKKGFDAAARAEHAEKALRESERSLLPEERVPFPGDEGEFAVNWLGRTPFLQAVVNQPSEKSQQLEDLKQKLALSSVYAAYPGNRSSLEGIATRSGRFLSFDDAEGKKSSQIGPLPTHGLPMARSPYSSLPNNQQEPKALVLHVMLTDKTFFHDPLDKRPQHLKIDVLFNGQLSSSVLIHTGDIRSGAKSLNQIFAGTRIDYMAERPWILHPSQSDIDSGCSSPSSTGNDAHDRWAEICKALMNEADQRGVNVDGERPPTAAYFRDLASMQMPDMIKDMQRSGGRRFGVIDMIITVGTGKKTMNNVVYLKAPTRLADDQFCYEVKEGRELTPAGVNKPGPRTFNTDEQGAEGNSDFESSVLAQDTIFHGRPDLPSQGIPLLPPQPALPWNNPFTGSLIPSRASLGPLTSSVEQPLSQSDAEEPPQKRGRFPTSSNDEHKIMETSGSKSPPRRPYPSAHGPSIPPARSFPLSVPDTAFNVNQYDNFEHANPYQLPYTGMMTGLDFASFDGPISSPLRIASGGQLTLPSFVPTPEEVIPSPAATSTFSSPYSQPSAPFSHGYGVVFSSDNSTPYNSVGTSMGYGIPNAGHLLNSSLPPGYVLQGPTHSALSPLGAASRSFSPYASVPYMPPLRRPSNGPPPPMGLFKVTEKPKKEQQANSPASASNLSGSGTLVVRLVIRMGGRVIVSHHFKIPRQLPAKTALNKNTSVGPVPPAKVRKESPDLAEWTEQAIVQCRGATGATGTSDSPPNTSLIDVANLQTTTSLDRNKRDSFHDGLARVEVPDPKHKTSAPTAKESEIIANTVAVETSGLTNILSGSDTYAQMHNTANTGILGVQGPKANLFVFDNPEELLRKKKSKAQAGSRSVSPFKVDTPLNEATDGSAKGTEPHKHAVESKDVETGSSSPLSELSQSPQLSFTADMPPKTGTNAEASLPVLQLPNTPAVPTISEPTVTRSASFRIPLPASVPQAPPVPSMLPSSPIPIASPEGAALKRKRAPERTPKRASAGTYVKQPRSPDRLDAKDNPPLNRDCVIQYAVSERKGGALRQVKSERRGVFKEDSVVVGCRFFVGGC